jgi:hypothetical protein
MRSSKCYYQTLQHVYTTDFSYNYTVSTKLQDHQNYVSTTTAVNYDISVFQNYTVTCILLQYVYHR